MALATHFTAIAASQQCWSHRCAYDWPKRLCSGSESSTCTVHSAGAERKRWEWLCKVAHRGIVIEGTGSPEHRARRVPVCASCLAADYVPSFHATSRCEKTPRVILSFLTHPLWQLVKTRVCQAACSPIMFSISSRISNKNDVGSNLPSQPIRSVSSRPLAEQVPTADVKRASQTRTSKPYSRKRCNTVQAEDRELFDHLKREFERWIARGGGPSRRAFLDELAPAMRTGTLVRSGNS